jgi:hypothetical protein
MVWLKNLYYKIVNRFRKKEQDPEEMLNERIKEMRKKDPFIYK